MEEGQNLFDFLLAMIPVMCHSSSRQPVITPEGDERHALSFFCGTSIGLHSLKDDAFVFVFSSSMYFFALYALLTLVAA